ncbi:hypothetical protein [Nocardia sp. NPDC057353]|uniref:hypothetical protein n=1 Tax=Nocardia sp. NPDC057353 TaxID=3346104 RepID=UPI003630EB02
MTLIAAAVAAGAAAGAGDTAKQVIVDAYTGLRGLMIRRYGVVDAEVVSLESEPQEPLRRQLLARQLAKTGAGDDPELQTAAQRLLQLIADQAPGAAGVVGIRLSNSTIGKDLEIADLSVATGIGFEGAGIRVDGSVKIEGTRVKESHTDPPVAHG